MVKVDRFFLLFIPLLTLIIGLGYLSFGPVFSSGGDFLSYEAVALNILNGNGFSYNGIDPMVGDAPAYPLFLAGIYKVFGHSHDAVRIVQILLLAGIGIMTYLASRRHLKLSGALSGLAAVLVVVWPYFILYTTLLLTETFYAFFLMLGVFFLLEFNQSFSKKTGVISGLAMTVAALARPIALFLPFWSAFFGFLLKRKKEIFKKQLLIILVCLAVLSPWTIRNFIQFKTFIPVVDWLLPSIGAVFMEKYAGESYFEPLTSNPAESIKARLKNIVLFWNPGAQGTRAQELLENNPQIKYAFLIYKVFFFILLFLCFLSLLYIKRKEVFLLWSVIFYSWVVSAIILPYPRYTLPIIPLVIMLALFSISRILNHFSSTPALVEKQINS